MPLDGRSRWIGSGVAASVAAALGRAGGDRGERESGCPDPPERHVEEVHRHEQPEAHSAKRYREPAHGGGHRCVTGRGKRGPGGQGTAGEIFVFGYVNQRAFVCVRQTKILRFVRASVFNSYLYLSLRVEYCHVARINEKSCVLFLTAVTKPGAVVDDDGGSR